MKLNTSAAFDLSARAKLRLTGADRLRYLNGQVSNDVRKATEALAIRALVLNTKGRINADIFIRAEGDSLLIDAEPEAGAQLTLRLERYIIADDVQLEDVTESFALFHVTAADAGVLPAAERRVTAERFGCAGSDFWLRQSDHDVVLQELAATLPMLDEAAAEAFRIERGVPRWGRELTDEIIPTEANLEASAIDYAKGCYIGQEVISRIKMSGQRNKRLCGLVSLDATALASGMRLKADGKDAGWITSATWSERLGRQIALGFVKRGFQGDGGELEAWHAGAGGVTPAARVTIVALPFA